MSEALLKDPGGQTIRHSDAKATASEGEGGVDPGPG